MTQSTSKFKELLDIVELLRSENGCPWDRKQTPASIKKYLLEETAELAEAIDKGDQNHICEEVGDLFFILCMLSTIYGERQIFTVDDALQSIIDKMIRRHPHVFSNIPTGTDEELRRQWNEIKRKEGKR